MNTKANKAIIQRFVDDALNKKNLDVLDELVVEDLNSANGTYVNRARVAPGQKRGPRPECDPDSGCRCRSGPSDRTARICRR